MERELKVLKKQCGTTKMYQPNTWNRAVPYQTMHNNTGIIFSLS